MPSKTLLDKNGNQLLVCTDVAKMLGVSKNRFWDTGARIHEAMCKGMVIVYHANIFPEPALIEFRGRTYARYWNKADINLFILKAIPGYRVTPMMQTRKDAVALINKIRKDNRLHEKWGFLEF